MKDWISCIKMVNMNCSMMCMRWTGIGMQEVEKN